MTHVESEAKKLYEIQYFNNKVDLPPPVHFSICTTRFPYLNISKKNHTIYMGEVPKS